MQDAAQQTRQSNRPYRTCDVFLRVSLPWCTLCRYSASCALCRLWNTSTFSGLQQGVIFTPMQPNQTEASSSMGITAVVQDNTQQQQLSAPRAGIFGRNVTTCLMPQMVYTRRRARRSVRAWKGGTAEQGNKGKTAVPRRHSQENENVENHRVLHNTGPLIRNVI